jgi:hypothetical protein
MFSVGNRHCPQSEGEVAGATSGGEPEPALTESVRSPLRLEQLLKVRYVSREHAE